MYVNKNLPELFIKSFMVVVFTKIGIRKFALNADFFRK